MAIFITYVTEMSVFPAILSLAVSSGNWQWSSKYFIPVGCFLVFFMGKFLGSTLARFTAWPRNTKMSSWFVLCLALLRLGFIPIFLVCNIAPNQRVVSKVTIPTPIPITKYHIIVCIFHCQVIFESDTIYLITNATFAIISGYINSIVMMYGPKMLDSKADQGRAASILVFFLVFGLAVGSILSSYFVKLL